MQPTRPTSQGRGNSRAPTMVMIRREAGGSDFSNALADTTLLILGPGSDDLRDYRLWAEELGGLALQIGNEYALTDWLDRNMFVRAAVLIDDSTLDARDAMRLAAEIRLQRPDVAVTLLRGPKWTGSSRSTPSRPRPSRPDPRPPDDAPGYAIFNGPLSRCTFARAMASARRHVISDREFRTHLGGRPVPVATPTEPAFDDLGPHSGRWIIPMVTLGLAFWITLGVIALTGR
jgi:hypothetical protein